MDRGVYSRATSVLTAFFTCLLTCCQTCCRDEDKRQRVESSSITVSLHASCPDKMRCNQCPSDNSNHSHVKTRTVWLKLTMHRRILSR